MSEDLLAPCPVCGYYRDTPNHELGCPEGRATEEVRAKAHYGVIKLDADGYEEGNAGWWHRRYDEQHQTVHTMEDTIADLRARLESAEGQYRRLQELSGQALVRSHLLRGDRELSEAKTAERLDAALVALWMALISCRRESERADRNLRFAIEAERRPPG